VADLHKQLIDELLEADTVLEQGTVREQVKALVPINFQLRDLGGSTLRNPSATSARKRILLYLRMHVGVVISGDELMVVSGISEYARRVRELRIERGWPILTGVTVRKLIEDGEDASELPKMRSDEYFLRVDQQDEAAAGRWKFAKKLKNSDLGTKAIMLKYFRHYVGQAITGEELDYVTDIQAWPRRIRELRTEHGWPIYTSVTGRPDLPVGTYVLEEDRQAPPHDRKIKDRDRRTVLQRDEYTCQDCGWTHEKWNKSDPRHLEVHHLVHHANRGPNTPDNLLTLCNICHDERHAQEKSKDV
jgi:hypothetical protein